MRGLLLGLGAGIVAFGQLFRFSLVLPGHHGLEAMAAGHGAAELPVRLEALIKRSIVQALPVGPASM